MEFTLTIGPWLYWLVFCVLSFAVTGNRMDLFTHSKGGSYISFDLTPLFMLGYLFFWTTVYLIGVLGWLWWHGKLFS